MELQLWQKTVKDYISYEIRFHTKSKICTLHKLFVPLKPYLLDQNKLFGPQKAGQDHQREQRLHYWADESKK